MAAYTRATLVKDLTHLMRLPTGDKLSLRAFFDEAQGVLRRAREAGLEVPPAALEWITGAEQRSANPIVSASATAALIEALHRLEAS